MEVAKIIAVIHARGGSKRIPLKNIKPLNGTPLIVYSITSCLKSKYLDRVIVSTDHEHIKSISLGAGAEVPFDRPKDLSEDVPSELVTKHAVEFVENEQGEKIDIVVTIQPTTPFFSAEDIDATIELIRKSDKFNTAFTVSKVSERPEWMFYKSGDHLVSYEKNKLQGDIGVVQSLKELWHPNGAIYVTRRPTLFEGGVLIDDSPAGHEMSHESSVDIDEPIDFLFAEFIAKNLNEHKL
ncbi:MAG: acylneuraminate cytidylyltransferase family protein [Oligoflexales bacterium]